MKTFSIFFISLLVIYGSSCEKFMEKKYFIKLENKSNLRLYTAVGTAGEGTAGIYPDTSLPANKPIFSEVAPKTTGYVIYSSQTIEKIFEQLPKDTLSVYVFNADSVDIQGWNTVRNGYKLIKRYDLSLSDVQEKNYIIPFP